MASSRSLVSALALSATAFVSFLTFESFVPVAKPDPIGVPTVGFGTTKGVKLGQKITVERALVQALTDANAISSVGAPCL